MTDPARARQAANDRQDRLIEITLDPRLPRLWKRLAWILLGLALLAWIAYLVREIWLPLAIAFLIAMVLDPVVDRMERRGWKRGWATLLIFAAFFAVLGTSLYFAIPAVVRQASEISEQVSQYIPSPGHQKQAQLSLNRLLRRAKAPSYVSAAVERAMAQLSGTIARSSSWISAHAVEILSNLIWLAIIPIVTFYALKDFHVILAKALLLVPRDNRDFVQTMVAEVTAVFARFLRGLLLVSFLNGVATMLLLLLLRMPNAFTLGAIAGALYTVPYVGAITTVALVSGVAFLHGGLQYMLIVIAANILLHQVLFDQLISPRILGGHVGLHPILSIVALLMGNLLLGIIGMLLAVPVAASIQIVVLALIPKLSQEVEVAPQREGEAEDARSLEQETKADHAEADATDEIHRSVAEAVEAIEAEHFERRD